MSGISERLAAWSAAISLDRVPAEVVESTKLRILDLVGVMLAARDLDLAQAADIGGVEGIAHGQGAEDAAQAAQNQHEAAEIGRGGAQAEQQKQTCQRQLASA